MPVSFSKRSKRFYSPPVVEPRKLVFDVKKVDSVPYVAKLNDDELKLLERECAICQSNPDHAVRLPCGHDFCRECESKWHATCGWRTPSCPLCRAIYRSVKLVDKDYTQAAWIKEWHDKKEMLVAEAKRVILWSRDDPMRSPYVIKNIIPGDARRILLDTKHSALFPTVASAEDFMAQHKWEMWKEIEKNWKESPWSKMKPTV
jgi:hypothetical protein